MDAKDLNGYWKGNTIHIHTNENTSWKSINIKSIDGKIIGYGYSRWRKLIIPFIIYGDYSYKSKYFNIYKIHIDKYYNIIKYDACLSHSKIILNSGISSGILTKYSFRI